MRCHSKAGKTFLAIAVFFGVLALFMRLIAGAEWLGSMLLFFLFALLTGIPGWLLCKSAARLQQDMQQKMQRFIDKHSSFYMSELADHLQLSDDQARQNTLWLMKKQGVNLIYDSDADRYAKFVTRLEGQIVEKCPSCYGRIIASEYIEHQDVNCPFCGSPQPQYSTH